MMLNLSQKVYKINNLFSAAPSEGSSPPSSYTSTPCLLKYRFPKAYRHKTLDTQLTRTRISHEAKCLAKCKRAGVDVPAVRAVDVDAGILLLEWIEGYGSVREVLGGLPEDDADEEELDLESEQNNDMDIVQSRLERLQLSRGEPSARRGHLRADCPLQTRLCMPLDIRSGRCISKTSSMAI